ncbi:unnamed protein product [Amoebophrya sp. A120]|nr:unnamed protein product [Amoebophrya sp. A120]|eukprot:GSA120T00017033001.1
MMAASSKTLQAVVGNQKQMAKTASGSAYGALRSISCALQTGFFPSSTQKRAPAAVPVPAFGGMLGTTGKTDFLPVRPGARPGTKVSTPSSLQQKQNLSPPASFQHQFVTRFCFGSGGAQRTANFKRVREEQLAKMKRLRIQQEECVRHAKSEGKDPKDAKLHFQKSEKKCVGIKGLKKPKGF